jgi:CheY-like chemotaxis protein
VHLGPDIMGLKGRLEDLPLLDMLQIIAFSRKSGFLRVAGPKGRGAVLLKEGRVLFSYSWSTLAGLEELVRHPDRIHPEVIREHIESSLRELGGLREGHFRFELADPTAADFGGIKIQPFLLQGGIDAQELLLDLAVEIDSERREASSLLELAFQGDLETRDSQDPDTTAPSAAPPSPPAPKPASHSPGGLASSGKLPAPSSPGVSVVLVDDEAPVRSVVGAELAKKGYKVFTASNPTAGAATVEERVGSGERVIVVVDLKMPTSSERTFYGGFELVRRVRRTDPALPVLLMIEGISEKAKSRAKELGIRRMVVKPTLSKIDQDLYVADLRDFAGALHEQLDKLRSEAGESAGNGGGIKPGEGDAAQLDFLAVMTRKLVEPGGSTDVSRLVMQVAARFLERGVLFVVKGDVARGLAAFGIGRIERECVETAGKVSIEISQCPPLAEAVRRGSGYRVTDDLGLLDRPLLSAIGRARATEAVLIPLLFNRMTLLLLYGDNGASGRPFPDLARLELFIAQAGMALENKLLQQKLSVAGMGGAGLGQDALA